VIPAATELFPEPYTPVIRTPSAAWPGMSQAWDAIRILTR
jgi:hypothetical protein